MDLVICSLIQFTQENEKSEPFSYRKKVRIFLVWWASQDLNPGPSGYEKIHDTKMPILLLKATNKAPGYHEIFM